MKRILSEAKLLAILVFAVMLLRIVLHLIFMDVFGPCYISEYVGALLFSGCNLFVYAMFILLCLMILRVYPRESRMDKRIRKLLYALVGGLTIIIVGDLIMLHEVGHEFEWNIHTMTGAEYKAFFTYLLGYGLESVSLLALFFQLPYSKLKISILLASLTPLVVWLVLYFIIPLLLPASAEYANELVDLLDDFCSDVVGIYVIYSLSTISLSNLPLSNEFIRQHEH